MASEPKRVVTYSPLARADIADTYNFTAHQRGVTQAGKYVRLLDEASQQAAAGGAGYIRRVENYEPPLYVVTVKWGKAKYAHNVFFRYTETGIYVLRVLHSSMNAANYLPGAE